LGIFTDGDLSIAQGIVWAIRLDLVDHFVGLHGQVLGKRAGFLMGQDEVQVFIIEQGAMGIVIAARRYGKTAVVIFPELG
jgi:hypothetical protein